MPSSAYPDRPVTAPSPDDHRPMMPAEPQEWRPGARLTVSAEQRASAVLWLVVLLTAALGLRLLIFALGPMGDVSLAMDEQSPRYLALAGKLATEQTFALDAAADDGLAGRVSTMRLEAGEVDATVGPALRLETYRTPGYPAFLALFEWLGMGGRAVLVTQCVLGAICVLLVYQLTLALLDAPRAALVAAAIMALHPASVAATNVLMPDVLWLTLMLAGLWLIVSNDRNPTGSLAIGGLLMGLAALVQPYALVLITLLALWVCLRRRTIRMVGAAVVAIVTAAIPVGAWMGRNYTIGFGPHLSSQPVIDRYFHTLADMRRAAGEDASVDALAAQVMRERGEDEPVLHAMDRLSSAAIGGQSRVYLATLKRNALHLFTDHSLEAVYRQFGITYDSPGVQRRMLVNGFSWRDYTGTNDDVTLGAALGWTLLNGLLLLGAVVGLTVMLVRGKWLAALLLVGLLALAVASLHSGLYGRPQLTALAFEAALVGGLLTRGQPRPVKAKKSREQKRLEKMRRRQEQAIGVAEDVTELGDRHEPIIPGGGPRHAARPI